MSDRAGLFESDFDVSSFAPKEKAATVAQPSAEAVRKVSEEANFHSREPVKSAKVETPVLERRQYRTGRNVQLNLRVTAESYALFYELADNHGWVLGLAFEKALTALQNELAVK